jgi:hypothetical protein
VDKGKDAVWDLVGSSAILAIKDYRQNFLYAYQPRLVEMAILPHVYAQFYEYAVPFFSHVPLLNGAVYHFHG